MNLRARVQRLEKACGAARAWSVDTETCEQALAYVRQLLVLYPPPDWLPPHTSLAEQVTGPICACPEGRADRDHRVATSDPLPQPKCTSTDVARPPEALTSVRLSL